MKSEVYYSRNILIVEKTHDKKKEEEKPKLSGEKNVSRQRFSVVYPFSGPNRSVFHPKPSEMNRVFGCKTTQRKFTKKVDDDEETMSVEDAVPCDQRTIGVVDSGGTGKRRARLQIPNGRYNQRVGEKRADEAKTGQKRRGKTQTRAAGPQKTITRFTGPPPQASECLLRLKKKAVENTWCLYVIYIRYASKK